VPRYEKVTLEGLDANGKKLKVKAWGLLAQVFQHETEHLQGILDVDKMEERYEAPRGERLKQREEDLHDHAH
jgi:peptide deformylase